MSGDLSLTVSKELVIPILEAKIKAAIATAMGGEEELLDKVLNSIINQKVDKDGKISSYSSDNKYSWFDVTVTKTIQQQIKESIIEEVKEQGDVIKEAVKKFIKSSAGSNLIAQAMVDGMNKSFESSWMTNFKIDFKYLNKD